MSTRSAVRPVVPVFVLPAVLALVQLVFTHFAAENQPDRQPLDVLAYLLLAAGPAVLLARRRHPVPVTVAVLGITLAYVGFGYPYGPVFASPVAALATAVVTGHRRASWVLAAAAMAVQLSLQYATGEPVSLAYAAGVAAWLTAVLAVAEVIRVRRERSAEAERTRAEEAKRRAGEERLQIARELHDVLAHHISLINIQAGVALHLMDTDPGQARDSLTVIKQESRDVLRELRSALDVLRGSDEAAPRAPTPGLDRLGELVERSQAAGLTVHTVVDGAPRPLPARVDTAAFRIVQEALTNVYRHAEAANATVRIGYGEQALTLQVDDDGVGSGPGSGRGSGLGSSIGSGSGSGIDAGTGDDPGVGAGTGDRAGGVGSAGFGAGTGGGAAVSTGAGMGDRGAGQSWLSGAGRGLAGMRERATALGGQLDAGARPGGGFRVRATLPLASSPAG